MAHNISDRKRLQMALAKPLAEWSGWLLVIDCGGEGCARGRGYQVEALAGFYPDITLGRCLSRFRCSICADAPVHAQLQQQRRGKPDQAIPLRGRGSMGCCVEACAS